MSSSRSPPEDVPSARVHCTKATLGIELPIENGDSTIGKHDFLMFGFRYLSFYVQMINEQWTNFIFKWINGKTNDKTCSDILFYVLNE